jgi:uncharacterized repeat protein (TIGR01451 family)
MKRRLGIFLLLLGISVAALPAFIQQAHATQQAPLPLEITKQTTEVNHTNPGGTVWYEITVHNPNQGEGDTLDLNCITDTLPENFSYQQGSTSGNPTDPGEPGSQDCPPFGWFYDGEAIGPGDSITLQFAADVSTDASPGVYCNEASALWDESSASTGPTAPVQVTELQAEAVQPLTCEQPAPTSTSTPPPPPEVARSATPTRTATARATATVPAAPPTKTPAPQSTVLAAQATPKAQQPAALPSTGSGGGSGHGTSTWVLAAVLIVAGAGLTLAGRKRA